MSAVDDLVGELRRVLVTLRSGDVDLEHAGYAVNVAQQTLLGIRGDDPCELDDAIGSLAEASVLTSTMVAQVIEVEHAVSRYIVNVLGCGGDVVHAVSSGGVAAPAITTVRSRAIAHSVVEARRLTLSLAQQAQMAEVGTPLAGAGTPHELRAASRLADQYGGSAEEWQKRSSSSHRDGGSSVETHWYEHQPTAWRVEFKFKRP